MAYGIKTQSRKEKEEAYLVERQKKNEAWTRENGEILVNDLKSALSKTPYISEVVLDDYATDSGQIFITLKMKSIEFPVGRGMKRGYYFGETLHDKFSTRQISGKINAVLKKQGDVSANIIESPKMQYDELGERIGYDINHYKIDYTTTSYPPDMKEFKEQPEKIYPSDPKSKKIIEFIK